MCPYLEGARMVLIRKERQGGLGAFLLLRILKLKCPLTNPEVRYREGIKRGWHGANQAIQKATIPIQDCSWMIIYCVWLATAWTCKGDSKDLQLCSTWSEGCGTRLLSAFSQKFSVCVLFHRVEHQDVPAFKIFSDPCVCKQGKKPVINLF